MSYEIVSVDLKDDKLDGELRLVIRKAFNLEEPLKRGHLYLNTFTKKSTAKQCNIIVLTPFTCSVTAKWDMTCSARIHLDFCKISRNTSKRGNVCRDPGPLRIQEPVVVWPFHSSF